jgi:peptidoglycan hydrolase CwlO-like protein
MIKKLTSIVLSLTLITAPAFGAYEDFDREAFKELPKDMKLQTIKAMQDKIKLVQAEIDALKPEIVDNQTIYNISDSINLISGLAMLGSGVMMILNTRQRLVDEGFADDEDRRAARSHVRSLLTYIGIFVATWSLENGQEAKLSLLQAQKDQLQRGLDSLNWQLEGMERLLKSSDTKSRY